MKIGFIISSLTQSIPYMTYLVSLGYEVIPIILKEEIWDDFHKNIIEAITNQNVLHDMHLQENIKLDCLIIMENLENLKPLNNFDFNSILKENAPIILNIGSDLDMENLFLHSYSNMHIMNYNSGDICTTCNEINQY